MIAILTHFKIATVQYLSHCFAAYVQQSTNFSVMYRIFVLFFTALFITNVILFDGKPFFLYQNCYFSTSS